MNVGELSYPTFLMCFNVFCLILLCYILGGNNLRHNMEISRQKTLFGTGLFHILHQKKKEKEFSPTDSVFCINLIMAH